MKYARLDSNGTVIEVFTPPKDVSINDCFAPAIAQLFVECPDNIGVHSTFVGGQWNYVEVPQADPAIPAEPPRAEITSIPTTQV